LLRNVYEYKLWVKFHPSPTLPPIASGKITALERTACGEIGDGYCNVL
jgi:hypothetical protein